MSLVKRVEISLREFIVRRHQFQLQRRIEKSSQRTVWRKRPVSRWLYWLVLKSIISQRLVGFTRQKKETKNPATCVLVICCLTRVINGKMIEDEVIYNFWRSSLEDFFLPVIKPPGTYFNNKLLPSCRSSKFSSSFPATSVLLCAPLDPVRPDRNSKSAWRQSVLSFLRQTLPLG